MADKRKDEEDKKFDAPESIAPVVEKHKRKGKVVTITSSRIVLDVKGNGEEIKFDKMKHSKVKVGDEIELL